MLHPYPDKLTAEVHDYHDAPTGVLASSLAKRAPGYVSLGFPDPDDAPDRPGLSATAVGNRPCSDNVGLG